MVAGQGGLVVGGTSGTPVTGNIPPAPTFQQLYEEYNFKTLLVDIIISGHHLSPRPRDISWTFQMGTVPTCSFVIDNPQPLFININSSVQVWVGFNNMARLVFNGYVESISPYEAGLRLQCSGESKKLDAPYKRNISSTDGSALVSNLIREILQNAGVNSYYVNLPAWTPGATVPQELALQSYGEAVNKLSEPFGSPYYEMPTGQIRVEVRDPIPAPEVFRNYFAGILHNGAYSRPEAITNDAAMPRIRSISSDSLLREVKNKIIVRGAEIPQIGGDGETDSILLETEVFGPSPWIPDLLGVPQYNELTIDNELLDDALDVAAVGLRYFDLYNRLIERLSVTIEGDPDIFVGATVGIIDVGYTGISSNFFVNGYTSTINENDFSTSLELLGGRASGVTPFMPPFAIFTWTNRYSAIPPENDDYRLPEEGDLEPYPPGGGSATPNEEQAGAKLAQVVPVDAKDPEGETVGGDGVSTVTAAPSPANSGTSMDVDDASVFPATPFYATVRPDSPADSATAEVVEVTNISMDTLTIVRAQGGTTAKNIANGWLVAVTSLDTSLESGGDTVVDGTPGRRVMITFDASASVDPDGTIVSYAWTDDQGHTGTGRRWTVAYDPEDAGSTIVTLTVTDSSGLQSTDAAYVNINTEPPQNGYITGGDGVSPETIPDLTMEPDPEDSGSSGAGGAVSVPSIYVAGSSGGFCSTDGGETWVQLPTVTSALCVAVGSYGGSTLALFGAGGSVVATLDDCETIAWSASPFGATVTDIAFFGDESVICVGLNGEIAISFDSGKSWSTVTSSDISVVYRVIGNTIFSMRGIFEINSAGEISLVLDVPLPQVIPVSATSMHAFGLQGAEILYAATWVQAGTARSFGTLQNLASVTPSQAEDGGWTVVKRSGAVHSFNAGRLSSGSAGNGIEGIADAVVESGGGDMVIIAVNGNGVFKSIDGGDTYGRIASIPGRRLVVANSPQFVPDADLLVGGEGTIE